MDAWMIGWTDGRMDGRTEGWMDGGWDVVIPPAPPQLSWGLHYSIDYGPHPLPQRYTSIYIYVYMLAQGRGLFSEMVVGPRPLSFTFTPRWATAMRS